MGGVCNELLIKKNETRRYIRWHFATCNTNITYAYIRIRTKSHVDSNYEDMIKSQLEKLEDVKNISKWLANGVVASVINRNNDFITYSDTNSFQDIDTCMKKAREYVDYLNILDTSEYHKGSIEDVTNFILDKYKNMQSEGEGYDLEHTWMNGEVLVIKVENGVASAWVQ